MTAAKTDPIHCARCGASVPRRAGRGRQPGYCSTCRPDVLREQARATWHRNKAAYNARRR